MADEIHLVPLGDSYYRDPAGFFASLRESRPVAPVRMPGRGRAWFLTRYADARAPLADPRLANDVHRWPGGARQRPSEAAGGVHGVSLRVRREPASESGAEPAQDRR